MSVLQKLASGRHSSVKIVFKSLKFRFSLMRTSSPIFQVDQGMSLCLSTAKKSKNVQESIEYQLDECLHKAKDEKTNFHNLVF